MEPFTLLNAFVTIITARQTRSLPTLHNAKLPILFTIFTNSGSTHLVNAAVYLAVLSTFSSMFSSTFLQLSSQIFLSMFLDVLHDVPLDVPLDAILDVLLQLSAHFHSQRVLPLFF